MDKTDGLLIPLLQSPHMRKYMVEYSHVCVRQHWFLWLEVSRPLSVLLLVAFFLESSHIPPLVLICLS